LESGRVEEKTRKEKTRRVDLARPGQKPGCNLLTFFFLLKQRNFDLKKKIDPNDPIKIQNPNLILDQI
jgi:hypothetical protein